MVAGPARAWYERSLARGRNPARWIEYAFSSSVMIVVIATLVGIREIGTLIAIFGLNAAMNLFGWSMEAANEGRDRSNVQWLHYIFGCIAGITPWIVIVVALATAATTTGVESAGAVAGRLYALSTGGSLLGTFTPVIVLLPRIGVRLTFISMAVVALVVGGVGLTRVIRGPHAEETLEARDTEAAPHSAAVGVQQR